MVISIEGPSGSGKSTWLRRQRELVDPAKNKFLDRPVYPRTVGSGFGAWMSSTNEYNAISAAVMMPEYDWWVDRFMLSRWVYRSMQFNNNRLRHNWRGEMEASYSLLRQTALREASIRINPGVYAAPLTTVGVLLPSLTQLKLNRILSGKPYPFDAEIELNLYTEMTEALIQDPIYGMIVKVIPNDYRQQAQASESATGCQ